jgi:hypothetical protein
MDTWRWITAKLALKWWRSDMSGGVLDFLNAFNQTGDVLSKAARNYELAKLSKEKDTAVYNPDQVDQKAAISGAVDADGKPLYTVTTDANGQTQVQSNLPADDGTQPAPFNIAANGTQYLGKTYDHAITDSERSSAKNLAMSGILSKWGDPEGALRAQDSALAFQRQAKNDSQGDQRFAWDKTRSERDQRQGDQAEADQKTMRDVDQKTADWFKSRLANQDGTQRAATMDDHLAASQYRASALTEAGKVEAAGKAIADHNSQALIKIQLDTAQRDQDLTKTASALAAGDLNAVKDFYNKYVPDGAKVVNVTRDDKGQINIQRESMDGRPMPPTIMKDTGQLTSALAAFKDPLALYNWTQNEFRNNLATNADKRGEKELALRGETVSIARDAATTTKKDTELMRTAGVAYEKARQAGDQPGMNAATLDLIKAGGVNPGAASTNDPAEVKLARALMQANPGMDMKTALQDAISKKGKSLDEIHQTFVEAGIKNMSSAEDSVKKADDVMTQMGYKKSGGRWLQAAGAATPATPTKPTSEADAQAQAKAAVAGGADKAAVNARLKTLGFKPID